jgi:hypothetical protein
MRALTLAKNALGCAAVASMLVLSSPGVKVVRAGEPHADEAVCSESPRVAETAIKALDQAILAEIQQPRPGPQRAGDDEIIVLNNQGYNYQPNRAPAQPLN